ncbi:MAG: hypothetical protein IPL45_13010 [Actinomycetales bacterium]|nr:hypothetical protein [Actinomycetales bacterium]
MTERLDQAGRGLGAASGSETESGVSAITGPDGIGSDPSLSSPVGDGSDRLEASDPLGDGAAPRSQETGLALAIVAALVVLLAVLGIWGLPRIGTSTPDTGETTVATGTANSTAPAGGDAGGPAATVAAPAGTPVPIVGSAGFEVTLGQVSSTTSGRAFDGKADTMWRSGWFKTANFGGINKQGIGIIADLGQQTPVRRVLVTVPAAQDITVYLANRASLDGATKIGSSSGKSGELVFELPTGPAPAGQLVIIVVTALGPDGEGRFRAQVQEVKVTT